MSIEGRKTKTGPLYRFDKMVRGIRLKSRYIYPTKREALEAQYRTVTEFLETGRIITIPMVSENQKTVLELMEDRLDWMTNNSSDRHLNTTKNAFKWALEYMPDWRDMPVELITLDSVRKMAEMWKKDLDSRGVTAQGLNVALTALTTCWNHPWDSRRAPRTFAHNPFSELDRYPLPKKPRYVPPTNDIIKLIEMAKEMGPTELYIYLMILYETAARPGEPLKSVWEDFSYERRTITLYTKKRKKGVPIPRQIKISHNLSNLLKKQMVHAGSLESILFPKPPKNKDLAKTMNKYYKKVCDKAGIKKFDLYCWRHWRASQWAEEGVPITTIKKRLGHANIGMTDNYLHSLEGV